MNEELKDRLMQRDDEWSAAFEYEEPRVLADLLRQLGQQLEFLTNPTVANSAMKEVWDAMSEFWGDWIDGDDWRSAFERESIEVALAEFTAGQTLVVLRKYAEAGLLNSAEKRLSSKESEDLLTRVISEGSAFQKSLPQDLPGKEVIDRLMTRAVARYALDHGEPLQPEGIALLAGLSVKSVRNAMALKGDDGLQPTNDGLVDARSAVRWLATKESFKDSIWKEVVGMEPVAATDPDARGDYVIVPEAKDGSWFRPNDRMAQGWKIGTKGSEEPEDDYWQALDTLMHMAIPRWRRPSRSSSVHSIVSAVGYRRLPRAEIEAELLAL